MMRSEEAAGYSKEGRAAAIALRRNHLKLASDYCRSRKSPPSTIAASSTSPSNFPLVLKSILKTNNRRELSQETDQKLPQKTVKVSGFNHRAMEKTYVMIKPDGVQRGLVGQIIQRFENKGFQLLGLKMTLPTEEILKEHYAELVDRPFFQDLMAYIGSGPVVCMCWQGQRMVTEARKLIGATNPQNAEMGSIRADLAQIPGRNVIHGADSIESAAREIALWFADGEELICEWVPTMQPWLLD